MEKSDPETELREKPVENSVENSVNNESKEDVKKSENLELKNSFQRYLNSKKTATTAIW